MTRIEILKRELFTYIPKLNRNNWFSINTDSRGRTIIISCKSKVEAERKKKLLKEYMELCYEGSPLDAA